MKAIILCAGYATRLYPNTLHTPKALLEYRGRAILDYIIDDLNSMDEIIIVSNHKFYNQFKSYILTRKENIKIIDDGSTTCENKLGAIKDLKLGLKTIEDDVLVMACDNLLDFSINKFIDFYNKSKVSSIMAYKEIDKEKLRRTGQAVLMEDRVIDFKEKPKIPISNYAIPPFYIFNKEAVQIIKDLEINSESLGSVIEELVHKVKIRAYKMIGKRIDLGNLLKN